MRKYAYLVHAVKTLPQGEAYVATKGHDFTCEPESFRGVVYSLAKEKGSQWVGTSTIIGNSVVYAFYTKTAYMRPNLPAYPIVRKMKGEA
jgi:hypothetical protein